MSLYEGRDMAFGGLMWQYLSSIVSLLAGLLFYVFIIRLFSTEIIGVFSLLSAILLLFSNVFPLGLGTGLQHFISFHLGQHDEGKIRAIIKEFILIGIALSFSASVSLWVLSPIFSELFFHTYAYMGYIRLIDVALFSVVFNTFMSSILAGLQNFRLMSEISMINIAVAYGLVVPFLLLNFNPIVIILAWITGYYLTTSILLTVTYRALKKVPAGRSDGISVRPIMFYSLPILISSLIGYGATYIDRFIVSFFMNLSDLGVYNFSLLIIGSFSILTSPVEVVLLSKLSELYGRGEMGNFRMYSAKAINFLTAFYMPVALIVAAISPSIILFLTGKQQYLPGSVPIVIILVVSSLLVSRSIMGTTLRAVRVTKIFIMTASAALVGNFALSALLIPIYGIDGAAVGYASTFIVSFPIVYHYARKNETFYFEKVKLLKIFVSSFIVFFLLLFIQGRLGYSIVRLFVYIVVGFAVYLFLIRVLNVFSEEDVDIFLGIFPSRLTGFKRFIKSLFV